MTSRLSWGIESTKSTSKTSLTLAVLVLMRGAFSTTLTSSTLLEATSMTRFSSTGALMPTLMLSWTTVWSLGASTLTWKTPGSSTGKRNPPSAFVYVVLRPPICVSETSVTFTPERGAPVWSNTYPRIEPESPR